MVAHAPPEAHVADRRYLVWTEHRMLRPELQHRLAHLVGQRPVHLGLGLVKEAAHPLALKAVRLSIASALRYARLSGQLGGGLPEEHDGTEQLVLALLGGPDKWLQLAPVLGRF